MAVEVKGSDVVVVQDHNSDRHAEKRFEFTHVYGPTSAQVLQ